MYTQVEQAPAGSTYDRKKEAETSLFIFAQRSYWLLFQQPVMGASKKLGIRGWFRLLSNTSKR